MALNIVSASLRDATLTPEAIALHALAVCDKPLRMLRYGEKLAFPLVAKDERRLVSAYRCMHEALKLGIEVPSAAEWLLDNFYLLEQTTRRIEMEIAGDYFRYLPLINTGSGVCPRVYALAFELVSHHEGKIDEELIEKFIMTYQAAVPLKMRELWAFPDMLKVALVKLATEVALESMKLLKAQSAADKFAQTLSELSGDERKKAQHLIARHSLFSNPAFVERLGKRIQGSSAYLSEALSKQLTFCGSDMEKVGASLRHTQVQLRMYIGNAITSLRLISQLTWADMFERLSTVELTLKRDAIYAGMDSESRACYRDRIEKFSKKTDIAESAIAETVLKLGQAGAGKAGHVGWYLIGDGRRELMGQLLPKARAPLRMGAKTVLYIGAQLTMAAFLIAVAALFSIPAAVLAVVPALTIAQIIVNRLAVKLAEPSCIPRMEIDHAKNRTMVVVPALIIREGDAEKLIRKLETHYLANPLPGVYFGLLTDFPDDDAPQRDGEDKLIEAALNGIGALNKKYEHPTPLFYMLHRKRELNKNDGRWMGKERKRGAIMDFCRLALTGENASFMAMSSNIPSEIKYIVTLDADTYLPAGSLKQLIGAMEHPLNKAIIDGNGRIVSGYGLLQPRIGVTASSAAASPFSRIFSGQAGIDTYSCAVSDVYQDLFDEGSFTGKGIIDIETFMKVLEYKLPDNSVLSHDLLEGSYVHTGFMSGVTLYDGYPSSYLPYSLRQHRWIRGDWQLLPFMGRYIKDASGTGFRTTLSIIARWKMLDNLRRSLLPVMSLLLILLAIVSPHARATALIAAFAGMFCAIIADFAANVIEYFKTRDIRTSLPDSIGELKEAALQVLMDFLLLPHEAYMALDAIIRTLNRVYFTRRNLLEWVTAAESERRVKKTLSTFYEKLVACPVAAAFILICASIIAISQNVFSYLIGAAWAIAPLAAYRICITPKPEPLETGDAKKLRFYARLTWRYFEELMSAQNGWWPPDNFQERPRKAPVQRTSPTNIGLGILSAFAAYDLGYISPARLLEMTEGAFATIEKAEKWNGHLYNWYSIPDLTPLEPRYVSTVDSGNLVAYLMTASRALEELNVLPDERMCAGLLDTAILALKAKRDGALENIKTLLENGDLKAALKAIDELSCSGAFIPKLKAMAKDFASVPNTDIHERAAKLKARIDAFVNGVNFIALYDDKKELFSIGYDVSADGLSKSYYDLLASEARQSDFIAIALGQIDTKHWFRLGRALTTVDKRRILLSWSGTMFEYLMPLILMKRTPYTLLDETYEACVDAQRTFMDGRVWGVSESAFYAFDLSMYYQYKAFGVPRIGLRSALGKSLVVSPYSSLLALMVSRSAALENLEKLESLGALGGYGFYEALDFTPERVSGENAFMLVKAYMAHHQGMGLCALDNAINGNIMQQRFASIPRVRAYELLLEEHKPQHSVMIREFDEALPKVRLPKFNELNASRTVPARTEFPEAQMLSNGGYSIMLTNTGSGFSRSADTMLNRWRADHIRGEYGIFFGVYDKLSGELLSPTLAPFYGDATRHTVLFDSDKAVFTSHSDALEIKLEVCVPPEYRAEVRRLTLHNISAAAREVDITAYFEVCMAQLHDDIAHPAFNKLFIDAQEQEDILLFSRRERRSHEKNYMYAAYAEDGKLVHASWCSDRMLFPGRTSTLKQAFMRPLPIAPISLPIDPVMCMRSSLTLEAGQSISISLVIGMAQNIEEAMQHANELCADIPRAFDLAWTHAQVELRYTQLQPRQAVLAQRLVSHLLFDSPLRSRADIGANKLERCALWRFGLSGDRPMLLMDVKRESQLETVELLSTLHDYLKMKGLLFDLVFISTSDTGYFRPVYEKMQALSHHGVYLIDGDTISEDERTLLSAKASLVCSDGDILSDMLNIEPRKHKKNLFAPAPQLGEFVLEMPATEFFNGIGGFSLDGSEYIMRITKDTRPPLPWSNVMANDVFGTLVTESGAGYTWSGNSRDMKLTPWYNDTLDPKGEALLLRDERSGKTWTVTPGALNGGETIVRHGFGYSSFETGIEELESKLTVFVDAEKPLKYYFLQLKNPMQRERELSVTLAVEWVLGDSPLSRTDVVTAGQGAALTAYNCMHNDGKVAYIMPLERECEMTSSREEIWRYMQDGELEGALGGGLGGAGAVRVKLRLAAGEYQNIAFVLGHTKPDAINFSMKAAEVAMALDNVQLMWRERLGGLKVKTPERSFDLMINGWLLYQMWSARLLGRTGFYQAGGAYGFRDQLQDVLTIMATHPQRVRMLIKEFAAHQFERGDVQHWWHPPARGVRTYVSDDRLFLPYAVTEYIRVTGSGDILDERACYLADEPIPQGRDDLYCEIPPACADGDIYEHCVRAIDVSLEFGAHGLPLMGGGDWNDGMDTIGRGGGESVWLAWFIIEVLRRFIPVCHMRGDETRAKKYEAQAEALLKNAEEHGWDGAWYRRAYFADGYPLGSAQNEECMIDCVSQAWAAIVGAQRAREAMDALEKMLLSEQDGILRLLMPPFDKTERRVGYIQGYVPGIRENGGQYTHGAIWAIIAFAVLGEKDRALKLFQLMNPIHHAQSRMQVSRYMGEPYVIAADVYGAGHRTGRAGWTWYTGSASWMYRAGVEWLLGIRRRGDKLEFEPCVPWSDFEAEYQFGKTLYRLKFVRGQEKSVQIELVDDGRTHDVTVVF